ncbi:MAG TPA: hypothetical protein VGM20_04125 [Gemmatimonadales bacterium]|jgi:hypothetical protein
MAVCSLQTARAQLADSAPGARLLAHPAFAAPFRDTVTVELHRDGAYRIAVWPANARVVVAPRDHADQPDLLVPTDSGAQTARMHFVSRQDGLHTVVVSPPAAGTVIRLWIWEDIVRSDTARGTAKAASWRIGFTGTAATPSRYAEIKPADENRPQWLQGGLLVSPASPWYMADNSDDPASLGWTFADRRILIRKGSRQRDDLDLDALWEFAQGHSSVVIQSPVMVTAGLAMTFRLDQNRLPYGIAIGPEAMHGHVTPVAIPRTGVTQLRSTITWIPQ